MTILILFVRWVSQVSGQDDEPVEPLVCWQCGGPENSCVGDDYGTETTCPDDSLTCVVNDEGAE